jgi:RNA polymerase sigma-70 factor (ECF subfamily)
LKNSDQQIIHYLEQGDQRAIGLLYDQYADSVFGVLRQMLPHEAAAQDVLQETFIKVWKNAHRYDASKATLFTWLLRIARNAGLDYLRAQKTRSDHEIQSATRNVSDMVTAIHPEHMDVPTHLSRLESKYGQVIHALFFLGLSQSETSEQLGIPLGTVKSRLRVGLRELRKVFGERTVAVLPIVLFFGMTIFS